MAEAIISGIIRKKLFYPNNIFASDKDKGRLKLISQNYKIKTSEDNLKSLWHGAIIILAVKPQVINDVLSQIGDHISSDQVFISIAAGIPLSFLEKKLKGTPIIRVMPNNPCIIGEGMSIISKGRLVSERDIVLCEKIFSSIGETMILEETYLNAVTALSGSGPAFIYKTLDALIQGGVCIGLSKDISAKLINQTALGAIRTILETQKTPKDLIEMVASKGGTTIEGLKVMEEARFAQILVDTVKAAFLRAKEIEEQMTNQEKH